ncbi:MAG: isoprenyl transferase [Alphaproteobacteria bacterium]|nr:isoprenyl transferase [Alphaproteobacteria bacterium]
MTSQPKNGAPRHVAIIMDGNGRWARARGLPRAAGHKRGADAVRRAVEGAVELGIDYLTLYGFSSENWKRPVDEVNDLMGLLRHYLRSEIAELHGRGVRIHFIGERAQLAPDIVALIGQAEQQTYNNTALNLIVALNYGGRGEITAAARSLARDVASGRRRPEDIDEAVFQSHLSTTGVPDPDVVIRTSGEKRISNFLLWQSAYAELVFIDTLWPDFGKQDFENALHEFHRRERRYGAAGG